MLPQNFSAPWRWTVLSCSSRPDLFCKYGRWLFPYKGRWSCHNRPLRLWRFLSAGSKYWDLICFAGDPGTAAIPRNFWKTLCRRYRPCREIRRLLSFHPPLPPASARQKSKKSSGKHYYDYGYNYNFCCFVHKLFFSACCFLFKKLIIIKINKARIYGVKNEIRNQR